MRITDEQAHAIKKLAAETFGSDVSVRLFGSRLDDSIRGGDVDLLVSLNRNIDKPALRAARLAARTSRIFRGRKVDVVIDAPNLMRLPIHEVALSEGREL